MPHHTGNNLFDFKAQRRVGVFGFFCAADARFEQAVRRHRRSALVLGILGFLVDLGVFQVLAMAGVDPMTDYGLGGVLHRFLHGMTGWFWIVAIVGLAGNAFDRQPADPGGDRRPQPTDPPFLHSKPPLKERIVRYAVEAQLAFYILHFTPIVVIGFQVVQWEVSILVKYIVITLSSLVVTLLLYDIVAFLIYFIGTGYLLSVLEVDAWTSYSAVGLLARFFKGLGSWFWVVAIMGIAGQLSQRGTRQDRVVPAPNGDPDPPPLEASRRPTWKDRLADYAKEAQLPFYVLHRTPMIIIAFYVVQWQVNALVKYVVIVLGTLVTILVVYDIAVRRTWPTRFLFGLRPGQTKS